MSWQAIAERVPYGEIDRWCALPGAAVTVEAATSRGLTTAQRRNRASGRMELLVWLTKAREAAIAAAAETVLVLPEPSGYRGGWTRAENEALVEAWRRGGLALAHAVITTHSREAIRVHAAKLGLPPPISRRRRAA